MSVRTSLLALGAAAASIMAVVPAADAKPKPDRPQAGGQQGPLVIAHRGASGYRPEHTLASYALGARMGADYIEPDLVTTKDGVLIARHEPEIGGTTDVAEHPEFADRKVTKVLDGVEVNGWWAEDFTLAEIKTLRAKERIPAIRPGNAAFDKTYRIPTFQEVIDLSERLSKELRRPIGIYPETKHPTYFRSIGKPLEPALIRTLERNGLNRKRANVFVQSFETTNLKQLNNRLKVPLVQLMDSATARPYDLVAKGDPTTYGDLATRKGLRGIARYADGVGPNAQLIVPRNPDGSSAAPTSFVTDAHEAGLLVHPFTFRRENSFLPLERRSSADPAGIGDLKGEIQKFIQLGVDGYFTDNPDVGVLARDGDRTDGT
jgi:glycerophosphoryl diester phosphodiesterase